MGAKREPSYPIQATLWIDGVAYRVAVSVRVSLVDDPFERRWAAMRHCAWVLSAPTPSFASVRSARVELDGGPTVALCREEVS